MQFVFAVGFLAFSQPRSQGLSSNRPLRRARRDPGNEVGFFYITLCIPFRYLNILNLSTCVVLESADCYCCGQGETCLLVLVSAYTTAKS